MSSPTKHDASVCAGVRLARIVSGPLRIHRQTPLVAVAKADLDRCRAAEDANVTRQVVSAIADVNPKNRASLRSAYRPKPMNGGAYSMVGSVSEEQISLARPSHRPRRPRTT